MVAGDVAHGERLDGGKDTGVEQRQPVGRVIRERVAALLRFQQQGEGGIALDVDPLDRIHLHRDIESHEFPSATLSIKPNKPLTFYRQYNGYR